MNKRTLYLAALCALPLSLPAQPALVNYQGRITDGTNLVNGVTPVTLEIYDQAAGGALLYADSNDVAVVDGLYSTHLGDDTVAGNLSTALASTSAWLQVVIGNTPLIPRERLVSVPYAMKIRGLDIRDADYSVTHIPLSFYNAGNHITNVFSLAQGATISGGTGNKIAGRYGVIAGGNANEIQAQFSTIGGGSKNVAAGGDVGSATVSGGYANEALGQDSAVGGGYRNIAAGREGTIPGGGLNTATNFAFAAGTRAKALHEGSFVWGDYTSNEDIASTTNNQVTFRAHGGFRLVGGAFEGDASGLTNFPATWIANQAADGTARIALHESHTVEGDYAAALGGQDNAIGAGARHALIGGGYNNTIGATAIVSTVSGGSGNDIGDKATYATISGGLNNLIDADSSYSAIAGGVQNVIQPGSVYSTIGGGSINEVRAADYGVIDGGYANVINTNVQAGVIGGGSQNRIDSNYAVVSGGQQNTLDTNAAYATISGGRQNSILPGSALSVIGGGYFNEIEGEYAGIFSGYGNEVGANAHHAVIGGGRFNRIGIGATGATIGGGSNNAVGVLGYYATVPGGINNLAREPNTFAAGNRAKAHHTGAFVWGDAQNADVVSAAENEFRIRAGGGVQITSGALNPTYLLSVAGTIRAEEVVVETGWADYVFEPDFVLRGLDEVEAHIAEKGHLPDIPSAADIQENGVSLGDMQTLMMQKIEELTLYIIEQNKRIAQLEAALER